MPKPKALGSYIFAGGFTLGVSKYFDVVAHLENAQAYGSATAQRNFPKLPIYKGFEAWPVEEMKALDIPFLYGNPPCAAWSHAGVTAGKSKSDTWRDDPRVNCTREHFTLLERLRPKVWVWESVSQAFGIGREFVDELTEQAMALGYSVTVLLHDAKYLGLPQTRKRFFLICHNIELDLPPPAWDTETISEGLRRINDIGELHPSAAGYEKKYGWLLPDAVGPTNLWAVFNRVRGEDAPKNHLGNVAGRPSFLLRRDHPDRVAATIMHERVHPTQDRFLTLRELAHLCGFPADWELNDKDMHELSRGVMPPVAEHLARCVATALKTSIPITTPTYRLVDQLKPPGYEARLDLPIGPLGDLLMGDLQGPSVVPAGRPAAPVIHTKPAGAGVSPARADPGNSAGFDPGRGGEGLPVHRPPRPKPGVKRMAFLQAIIMMDRWTPAQMVAIVRHAWPTSKCSPADVSTQRRVIMDKGGSPPPTRRRPTEELMLS